ncbi:50S ribosomal L17 domain protein [Mycobacterium intracellulare]|nr:50S ribosomal L17 domain protein [Mycobacterium intracellulare]
MTRPGPGGPRPRDRAFRAGRPREPEQPTDAAATARVSWQRQAPSESDYGVEQEDPDAIDTDSIPVVSEEMLAEADYPDAEADYTDYTDAVPEVAEAETADDAAYVDADYADAGYPGDEYADDEYPDVAVAHTPPDADAVTGALETAAPEDEYPDVAVPEAEVEPEDDVAAEPDVSGAAEAGRSAQARPGLRRRAAIRRSARRRGRRRGGLGERAGGPDGRPTIHLPLDDPYQAPDGYPIKASARYGLYYTPGSDLYQDTLPEIWLSSEEVALANGFTRAD